MKSCAYCGRENADEAANCFECGTLFSVEEEARDNLKGAGSSWTHNLSLRMALKAGGGFVLIGTAVVLMIGRIVLDLVEAEHGGKIGKPGIYGVGVIALIVALPIMAFVLPLLGRACVTRCKNIGAGVATTLVALLTMMVLFSAREFRWFLPAYFFGRLTGTSVGYYVGSGIQLVLGAWLLGWIGKRHKPDVAS